MQWLLYGPMTAAVATAMVRHGHQVHQLAELGLPEGADLAQTLLAIQQKQWDILTTDKDLAHLPFTGQVAFDRSIVHLQLEGGDVEQDDAIDRLFDRYHRLSAQRLYTVTGSRVKIRQLPGAGQM